MFARPYGQPHTPSAPPLIRWLYQSVDTVRDWRRRERFRRHLAQFGDHLLDDIGLDRQSADAEIAKPFWRP